MKKILLSVFSLLFTLGLSAQIYDADFSTDGQGVPTHTNNAPPATGPQSYAGGTAPNAWTASYELEPNTDGSANRFNTSGNTLVADDYGGGARFESQAIDVSGCLEVSITAVGTASGVQGNRPTEFFEYYYTLDGGADQTTPIVLNSGAVDYSIPALDVSNASTMTVGFNFNENGSGDEYIISSFQVACNVLPVELSSFTATQSKGMVSLAWETASEINNSHFNVEHSQDGINFKEVGKVVGAGTTSVKQAYSYEHRGMSGLNYYRLKQVDFDGKFEYSSIQLAKVDKSGKINLAPTVAEQFIQVELIDLLEESGDIKIYSMTGQLMMVDTYDINTSNTMIDVSSLPKGYYILNVESGKEIISQKFIKK